MNDPRGGLAITVDKEGLVLETERVDAPFDALPNEEKLRLAAGKALTLAMGVLERVIAGDHNEDDLLALRVAAPLVSSWQRQQQSRGALRALEVQVRALDFSMAKAIAEDKEQLRHYLRVSQPDHAITKAMPQ